MHDPLQPPTAEAIAKHYSACMDSVNLINSPKPAGATDEQWAECVNNNKEHLRMMLTRDFWTNEDLSPFTALVD